MPAPILMTRRMFLAALTVAVVAKRMPTHHAGPMGEGRSALSCWHPEGRSL